MNWKTIGNITAWVFGILSMGAILGFVSYQDSSTLCKSVEIYIPGEQFFIEKPELERIMFSGQPIVGRYLDEINLEMLEQRLRDNPFIKSAKVYADIDGVVHVEIEQRDPVVRIFNKLNQDFYIDQKGYKMPVSNNYSSDVVVANGNIDEVFAYKTDTLKTPIGKSLYKVAKYISSDLFWKMQTEQLFVEANGDIEIHPRVGAQVLVLGTADSLEVKFRNLKEFYKQKMSVVGWDTYKQISAKYAGQIVCVKNKFDMSSVKETKETQQSLQTDTLKTN